MTREEVARAWFEEEYEPGRRDAARGRPDRRPDRDRGLLRVVSLRYLLLRTHEWDEDVLERLRDELRRPTRATRTPSTHRCAASSR